MSVLPRSCRPRLFPSRVLLSWMAVLAVAAPAGAQNLMVDEGTYLLSRNGQPIGTETFSIRRTGSGSNAHFVATGEVDLDLDGTERRISVAMEATAMGSIVSAYQLKEGGAHETEIYLTRSDRRFQARIVTPAGEQVREYRAAPGTILLEQFVTHHFFFTIAKISGASTTLPALVPRTGERFDLDISDTGTERIQVAGQPTQARRIHMSNAGVERDVWVDGEGRVLLVVNHETGLRAERRDLPG